jgi:hypothetical protein
MGIPRGGNLDCTMVVAAPVLPVGYVVSASRIADRRIILAGYRLADLLRWVCRQLGKKRFRLAATTVPKQKESDSSLLLLGRKNFDYASVLR